MKTGSMILSALFVLLVLTAPSGVFGAGMSDYCQIPPSVANMVPPNVLLLADVSGSMGYAAYQQTSDRYRRCSLNTNLTCQDDHDCHRSEGTCESGHCSEHHDTHCHVNADCSYDWGTCSSSSATTHYGTCSNDATVGCERNADCTGAATCEPRQTYEGYFWPEKKYILNADNIYYEYIPSGVACTIKYTYPCSTRTNPTNAQCPGKIPAATPPADALNVCSKWYCTPKGNPTQQTGDCGTEDSGNLLNFLNMSRIDLLRWAMTGGAPATCGNGTTTGATFSMCDPRVYKDSGMSAKVGSVCKDDLQLSSDGTVKGKGCILKSYGISGGTTIPAAIETPLSVAVPWTRISEGLVYQFDSLPVKPRMGAMFFDGAGVRSNYVYMGDFTGANSRSNYTYQNLLTEVNYSAPGSFTPTGPAFWDAKNYLSQTAPQYGGISQQSGSGDMWKNPMYNCPDKGGTNCRYIPCAQSFVMAMSDGLWNRPTCSNSNAASDPAVPAYQMHQGFTNVKAGTSGVSSKVSAVYTVGLFVGTEGERALKNVAMYGSFDNSSLTWPGGTTGYPNTSCTISDPGAACGSGQGSNCTAIPASSSDWDKNGDGVPDTYFVADDAASIRTNIMNAVLDMLARVASGTAASVLASGEGSGANLAQAIYYPRRGFFTGAVDWSGGLQNFWYYIDPFLTGSNIREEGFSKDYVLDLKATSTLPTTSQDNILDFFFDTTDQKAKARRYNDVDGNGIKGTLIDTVEFDSLGYIWEAGKVLWARDPATRKIYTPIDTTKALTAPENVFNGSINPADTNYAQLNANLTALRPLLGTDFSTNATPATQKAENEQIAMNLISWIRGTDFADGYTYSYTGGTESYRYRTVALDSTSGLNVWKLGDIINSTPKIESWMQINHYDLPWPKGGYDDTKYIPFYSDQKTDGTDVALAADSLARYKNRGFVFVGANDGMLHAFKLGRLGVNWFSRTSTQKATMKYCKNKQTIACTADTDCSAVGGSCATGADLTDLGTEMWAFIPRNVLPYLQYIKDNDNYCHLYTVDLSPYTVDVSIAIDTAAVDQLADCKNASYSDYWKCKKSRDSWRTVVIGGLRTGGACRNTGASCNTAGGSAGYRCSKSSGTTCTVGGNECPSDETCLPSCVNTPMAGKGYSSYFALDVTDFENPKLLWEFTNPELGYATSGPAVLRIGSRHPSGAVSDEDGAVETNGRWFAVFASGPTGPIDTAEHQFMGRSDQNLKVFVLDLKTGTLLNTLDTGIQNAFSGPIVNNMFDSDYEDPAHTSKYSDNGVYIGYVNQCSASSGHPCTAGLWNDGGVVRLLTREEVLNGLDISGSGPCTANSTALNPNCWTVSTVIEGVGPASSGISNLRNITTGKFWLFFGTGRYFYQNIAEVDDSTAQRHMIGLMDPCVPNSMKFSSECLKNPYNGPAPLHITDLGAADTAAGFDAMGMGRAGWIMKLCGYNDTRTADCGPADSTLGAQRVIAKPNMSTLGVISFSAFRPYLSNCSSGGKTGFYMVTYNQGGQPPEAILKGKVIMQSSTGVPEQIELKKSSFTKMDGKMYNSQFEGFTSDSGSLVSPPQAVKKLLHVRER